MFAMPPLNRSLTIIEVIYISKVLCIYNNYMTVETVMCIYSVYVCNIADCMQKHGIRGSTNSHFSSKVSRYDE